MQGGHNFGLEKFWKTRESLNGKEIGRRLRKLKEQFSFKIRKGSCSCSKHKQLHRVVIKPMTFVLAVMAIIHSPIYYCNFSGTFITVSCNHCLTDRQNFNDEKRVIKSSELSTYHCWKLIRRTLFGRVILSTCISRDRSISVALY